MFTIKKRLDRGLQRGLSELINNKSLCRFEIYYYIINALGTTQKLTMKCVPMHTANELISSQTLVPCDRFMITYEVCNYDSDYSDAYFDHYRFTRSVGRREFIQLIENATQVYDVRDGYHIGEIINLNGNNVLSEKNPHGLNRPTSIEFQDIICFRDVLTIDAL